MFFVWVFTEFIVTCSVSVLVSLISIFRWLNSGGVSFVSIWRWLWNSDVSICISIKLNWDQWRVLLSKLRWRQSSDVSLDPASIIGTCDVTAHYIHKDSSTPTIYLCLIDVDKREQRQPRVVCLHYHACVCSWFYPLFALERHVI